MTTYHDLPDTFRSEPEPEPDADPRPRDLRAERAVIGSMLLSRMAREQIIPILAGGEGFYWPGNETIYRTIVRIHDDPAGKVDPLTVAAALRTTGELSRVGGEPYLFACVDAAPAAASGEYYAEIVHTQWQLRRLYEVGAHLTQRARMQDVEPDELSGLALSELQAVLGAAAGGGDSEQLSVAARWEGFLSELEQQEDPRALDSPWTDLNEVVQFRPKELTIVGAATSGGKSLLALNQAAHVALRREQPVLVASIEMGGSELLARLAAAEGDIELNQLMRRKLGDREWKKLGRITPRMMSVAADRFVLDDRPGLTIPKIESRIRWMDAKGMKPGLVIVDYLQIVLPDGPAGRNRTQEVAGISLGLKRMADKFDVPVIALAQFNRSTAGRRPLITDFKDSSQIEQDASTVLLLHRDLDEDGNDTGPNAGKVMLIVAKNRNGQRGREIWLSFQGRYASLRNLTTDTPPTRTWSEIGVN